MQAQVRGRGEGQLRARVCNAAAAAVEVHSAVEAAAAMQTMVSGFKFKNRITVDSQAGCVSFQQGDNDCIIFSLGGGPRVQFVNVEGLPPSFIDVQRAQEVRGNSREMNPPQTAILQLPPASPACHVHCTTAFVIARRFSAAAAPLTIAAVAAFGATQRGPCAERRRRLPHLRSLPRARAWSAAARAAQHRAVAALAAATGVAAAAVPPQPTSAARVLRMPSVHRCLSSCVCE